MKKQLWICRLVKHGKEFPKDLQGEWWEELAPFPFTIDDLLLLRDLCEHIPEDFPESIEAEKIADKLQKLIKELKGD